MKKTEKIRYEIDPHNRLVYEKTGKKSGVAGFRTVLDGNFKIDENNYVAYHVKNPQGSDIPQQIKLKGAWSLNSEHNLVLTLDKWGNQIAGNKLIFESEITDAKDNMLFFSLSSKDSEGDDRVNIVKLSGRWQADEDNRLSFDIKKEKARTDRLTFNGAWEVNKQNGIIYVYEKSDRGKKEKIIQNIILKGYWDIPGKHRIKYILNRKIKSEFDFIVSVGKPVGRGLQYEVGIGAASRKKKITLFGNWKVSSKMGLLFEMPYEEGKINRVIFGAWGKPDKDLNLEIGLKNKIGKDLGIDIKLSKKKFKGQGEAFIRALKSGKEVSIVAGVGFRW